MSYWTNANGIIKLSGDKKLVHELLGEMIVYEDYSKADEWERLFNESIIPKGSEGSLQYFIFNDNKGKIKYKFNENHYYDIKIAIWGNLRDVENSEEIEKWFNNIVNNEELFVEYGCITYFQF